MSGQKQPLTIELDWDAYFRAFDHAHGGNPVELNERTLLWKDGWTYGIRMGVAQAILTLPTFGGSPGLEWPPPEDKERLRRLKVIYWRKRRRIVLPQLPELKARLSALKAAVKGRSGQMWQRVNRDEDGKRWAETVPMNLGGLEDRIKFIEDDLAHCDWMIEELEVRDYAEASKH